MVSLLVGVRYYIQNVDSGTFLELPDKLAESEVKTRPVKFSEKQLWTIVADQREPDVFLLENVAQKTWLGVVTEGHRFSQLVGHSRINACKWCLDPDLDGDGFWISFARTKTPRCLELGEFGVVLVAKRSTNDSQKWRFLKEKEAYQLTLPKSSSSLASGLYRIRSLNGTMFISLSEPVSDTVEPKPTYTNVLAYATSKEEDPVKSQKWFVTRSNDGTYSIQDAEQHLFLGCDAYDCYKYGPIHGLREAFGWDITPVGGGFAYTEEDAGPTESGGAEPDSDNEDGGGQSKVILDGHYQIQNAGSGKYLNIATATYFRSEPSHAPSRFLVRVSESNEAQIIPHSYVGLQSLVWRDSKIAVEDVQESAWQLIKDDDLEEERRFQLRPIGAAAGHVLKTVGNEIKLVEVGPGEGLDCKWDFVTIY
ncbi:hypothetical protein H1R20_g11288, partial [Candolleomyces eurysporus]